MGWAVLWTMSAMPSYTASHRSFLSAKPHCGMKEECSSRLKRRRGEMTFIFIYSLPIVRASRYHVPNTCCWHRKKLKPKSNGFFLRQNQAENKRKVVRQTRRAATDAPGHGVPQSTPTYYRRNLAGLRQRQQEQGLWPGAQKADTGRGGRTVPRPTDRARARNDEHGNAPGCGNK